MIVIPQALRIALPALSNEFITIAKLTSLVSVIAGRDPCWWASGCTQNFLVFETMLAVAFYYVLIVTIFDKLLGWLESHLNILRRTPRPLTLDQRTRDALRANSPSRRRRKARNRPCRSRGARVSATTRCSRASTWWSSRARSSASSARRARARRP